VSPFHFPVVVVCTKYDVFGQHESEELKWMCRALRYFSHVNDCDLVMTSFKDKGFVELKNILNTHVFSSTKTPKL
jgi:GTP-binding protein EngB required for normal cell division